MRNTLDCTSVHLQILSFQLASGSVKMFSRRIDTKTFFLRQIVGTKRSVALDRQELLSLV